MYKQRVGSRSQVINNIAKMTSGGLTKNDLKYNKFGKIVSKKMSNMAIQDNKLVNAGYHTKKGHFGSINMNGGVNTYNNIRNTSNKKVLAEKLLYGNDSQWSIFLSNQRNKKDITSNEVFDNLIQILKIIKQYNKVLSNVWVDNNITLFKNIVKLFNKLQNNNNIIYLFRILKFNEDWYDSILNLPENKKRYI